MQFQVAVARHLQDAQHLDWFALELVPGRRQQLAFGQHEAGGAQPWVGFRRHRRRPERRAQHRRLNHAGQADHLAHRQEVVAHETFDAVLAAVAGVAHARADHRLEVEGQPLLGAAGDVVQVEAHGPQEFPGAAAVLGLVGREDAADLGKLAHSFGTEHIARDPVQRLQVAQAAAALLDVGFDDVGAVAVAAVTDRRARPAWRR